MSRSNIDYLARKYRVDEQIQEMLKDGQYRDVMTRVLGLNIEQVQEMVGEKSRQKWERALAKPGRAVRMPTARDVAPVREQVYQTAYEKASSISGTIRQRMADKLRGTISSFEGKTGTRAFLQKRISGRLEESMAGEITQFFKAYTKKNPKVGMPTNVNAIAVTELRGAINNAKQAVAESVKEKNPGIQLKKRWIHNPHLSMDGDNTRLGHAMVDRDEVPMDKPFRVPRYKKVGGVEVKIGVTLMMNPHDPEAPADQVISCHCDVEYFS